MICVWWSFAGSKPAPKMGSSGTKSTGPVSDRTFKLAGNGSESLNSGVTADATGGAAMDPLGMALGPSSVALRAPLGDGVDDAMGVGAFAGATGLPSASSGVGDGAVEAGAEGDKTGASQVRVVSADGAISLSPVYVSAKRRSLFAPRSW